MTRPCGLSPLGAYWCSLGNGHVGECRRSGLRQATKAEILERAHGDLVTVRERETNVETLWKVA